MIGNDAVLFLVTHCAVFLLLTAYCNDSQTASNRSFCVTTLTAILDCDDGRLIDHVRKVRSDQSPQMPAQSHPDPPSFVHEHILGMYL